MQGHSSLSSSPPACWPATAAALPHSSKPKRGPDCSRNQTSSNTARNSESSRSSLPHSTKTKKPNSDAASPHDSKTQLSAHQMPSRILISSNSPKALSKSSNPQSMNRDDAKPSPKKKMAPSNTSSSSSKIPPKDAGSSMTSCSDSRKKAHAPPNPPSN